MIEKKADINFKDEEGLSMLHIAINNNFDKEFIEFLIKNGADSNA